MTSHCLILFFSTHHALKGEKVLGSAGIEVDAIPVPRQFSANCGISICFDWNDRVRAAAVLERHGVKTEAMHRWERE